MRRLRRLALAGLVIAPGALAPGASVSVPLAAGAAQAQEATLGALTITGAEVTAPMAGAPAAAAYMTIANAGAEPDRLVAVESAAARMVALHAAAMVEGVAKMAPVDGVEVPAGGSAVLAPRGLHVMLMGLTAPLAEGAEVGLTLVFERAGRVEVTAPVHLGAAAARPHSGG